MQEIAMEALVEMYILEPEHICKEISKCVIFAAKLKQLKNNFDAVDSGTWPRSRVRSKS